MSGQGFAREPGLIGFRYGGFLWRLKESPKDWRYGGFRAWCRWVFKGIAADEGD